MNYITALRNLCLHNSTFPKSEMIILDTLESLLSDSDLKIIESTSTLTKSKTLNNAIDVIVERVRKETSLERAIKLVKENKIYYSVFFNFSLNEPYSLPIWKAINTAFDTENINIPIYKILTHLMNELDLESIKGYEMITILALYQLEKAIKLSSTSYLKKNTKYSSKKKLDKLANKLLILVHQHCLAAYRYLTIALQLKSEYNIQTVKETAAYLMKKEREYYQNELNNQEKNIKKELSKLALDKRHSTNREVKNQVISDFMSQTKLNKDQFAETYASKYGYTFQTVRGWLRGYHITN